MIDHIVQFLTSLSDIQKAVFGGLAGLFVATIMFSLKLFTASLKSNKTMLFHQGRAKAYEDSNTNMISAISETNKELAKQVTENKED